MGKENVAKTLEKFPERLKEFEGTRQLLL